jgi:hypothetical protein
MLAIASIRLLSLISRRSYIDPGGLTHDLQDACRHRSALGEFVLAQAGTEDNDYQHTIAMTIL